MTIMWRELDAYAYRAHRRENGRLCWFFCIPRATWNGGLPWRGEVFDVSAQWLCFGVGVTVWPRDMVQGAA